MLKIAEKSRVKVSFFPKNWPPRTFLLHFYVTIFKKNQNHQLFFQKTNFAKNNIAFCLNNFGPTFRVKNSWKNYGFLDKNDQFLGQVREFLGNSPKSRTFRGFVISHEPENFVTEANSKIAEFVINHEFWQHWSLLFSDLTCCL